MSDSRNPLDTLNVLVDPGPLKDVFYDWHGLNHAIFLKINSFHTKPYDLLMKLISEIGDHNNFPYYVMGVAAYVVLAGLVRSIYGRAGNKYFFCMWLGIFLVLAGGYAATAMAVHYLKDYFEFARPYVALGKENITLLELPRDGTDFRSFPSGHATFISMMVISLWPAFGSTLRWLGVIIIAAVCWSRMALGMHFPADVLGGFLIALVLVPLVRGIIYSILQKIGITC